VFKYMAFRALFHDAVETTRVCKATRDALLQTPEEFLDALRVARLKLRERILEGAPAKIEAAALRGMSTADILNFNGNDAIDDVSVLFVLRGQRPNAPPPPPGAPPPLLDELRDVMAPFEIAHDWDGITSGNRLVARWTAPAS